MRYLILLLAVVCMTGCGKKNEQCTLKCANAYSKIYFPDRDSTELKPLIVRQYEPGSNFANKTGEKTYDSIATTVYHNRPFKNTVQILLISEEHDFEIELPDHTIYRISAMTDNNETWQVNCASMYRIGCDSSPTGCKVNGQPRSFILADTRSYFLELTK